MFSFGKKNGTRAMVAIMLSFIPLIAVLMVFPQLGDQVPMKVKMCIRDSFKSIGTSGIAKNGKGMQVIIGLKVPKVRDRFEALL